MQFFMSKFVKNFSIRRRKIALFKNQPPPLPKSPESQASPANETANLRYFFKYTTVWLKFSYFFENAMRNWCRFLTIWA
jgi:hypothetical protein